MFNSIFTISISFGECTKFDELFFKQQQNNSYVFKVVLICVYRRYGAKSYFSLLRNYTELYNFEGIVLKFSVNFMFFVEK